MAETDVQAALEQARKEGRMELQLETIGARLGEVAKDQKDGFESVNKQLTDINTRLAEGDPLLKKVPVLEGKVDALERSCLACQTRQEASGKATGSVDDGFKITFSRRVVVAALAALGASGGAGAWLARMLSPAVREPEPKGRLTHELGPDRNRLEGGPGAPRTAPTPDQGTASSGH